MQAPPSNRRIDIETPIGPPGEDKIQRSTILSFSSNSYSATLVRDVSCLSGVVGDKREDLVLPEIRTLKHLGSKASRHSNSRMLVLGAQGEESKVRAALGGSVDLFEQDFTIQRSLTT
jgi:hypothetical protein